MSSVNTKNAQRKRLKGRRMRGSTSRAIGNYAEDAWSLARRTAAGLNEIRKFINIETKTLDTTVNASVDYNGAITSVSSLAQGTDLANRVGDSVRIQHISLRLRWGANDAATGTVCRCIVFRDLEATGAANTVAVADVLPLAGAVTAVIDHINELYQERFSILFDETSTVSTGGNNESVAYFSSTHQGHIRFLGTTAAAASNGMGSVYVLVISNRVTTLLPTATFQCRLRFTDD